LRRSRERFGKNKDAEKTLKFVLNEFSKISAPVIPFIAEKIYQTVNLEKGSVHLQKWPEMDLKKVDKKLNLKMGVVREIVSAGLRERDISKIGLKWPLAKATIYSKEHQPLREMEDIIKEELNVKEIELKVNHKSEFISVELDTNITPELEAEGFARELARKVQAFRKELGLEKKDKIELVVVGDSELYEKLESQKEFIKDRTNAKKIEIVTTEKERFKNKTGFQIKDKKGVIVIK
jgi:isoleucyl-tRNA synthetase